MCLCVYVYYCILLYIHKYTWGWKYPQFRTITVGSQSLQGFGSPQDYPWLFQMLLKLGKNMLERNIQQISTDLTADTILAQYSLCIYNIANTHIVDYIGGK